MGVHQSRRVRDAFANDGDSWILGEISFEAIHAGLRRLDKRQPVRTCVQDSPAERTDPGPHLDDVASDQAPVNQGEWVELASAASPLEFCAQNRFDLCPPTDDKPFFFNMLRLGDLGQSTEFDLYARTPFVTLLVTLGVLLVLCAAVLLVPLATYRGTARPPLSSLGFFAAIGLGFLTLEIVFIQRFVLFLGFPTYALSVVLFALLVFTGLGSLPSGRVANPRRGLLVSLAIATALIALSGIGLQDLLRELINLPFAIRVGVAVLLLAPFGLTLGMAMPIGLRRLSALHPAGVPWAWGVNAVMSVLASVLAIAVAITWGFTAATVLAAAFYAAALAHAALGAWPRTMIGS
jgi:hypothetical protein